MCLTAAFWALSVFLATVIDAQQAAVDSVPTFKPPQSRPTFKDAGNGSTAKRELEVERTKSLKIGVLIPTKNEVVSKETGYMRSAGAIPIAIDEIRKAHLLDDFNFTFEVRYDECSEQLAAGYAVELIREHRVDAIIGPTCSTPAINVGIIAAFYNIPVYFWGLVTAHQLSDFNRFPTSTSMSADSSQLANAFVEFMGQYYFDRFAFLYTQSATEKCKYIGDDLKAVIENTSNSDITMTYSRKIENGTADNIQRVLKAAVLKARIFAICFDSDTDRRRFFLQVYDMKLDTEDYLYVMLDTRAYGFGQRLIRNITDSELRAVSEKKILVVL